MRPISQNEFKELVDKGSLSRVSIIDLFHYLKEDNLQCNKTPMGMIRRICNKTSLDGKNNILIMFNEEFLEYLIKMMKVDPARIKFVADREPESDLAKNVYGVESIHISKEQIHNRTFINEIKKMKNKFDVCFSNPPYSANIDLKILMELDSICDEMIIVHPSTWAIDMKGKSKLYNDFKKQFGSKIKTLEFFNGNKVFNIDLLVPCVITHIDRFYNGNINIKFFNEYFEASDFRDITKYGTQWNNIKMMFNNIKTYINTHGNIWQHNTFNIDGDKYYCQLAAILAGNLKKIDGETINEILPNSFYTMLMKDPEKNKGIRQPDLLRDNNPTPTFGFNTEDQRDNFINYLKTDFARFCLSFYKDGQNLSGGGAMEMIPWLDFTQEWNDEKLFKYFNVNEETQTYIREFLPDYHGIRK